MHVFFEDDGAFRAGTVLADNEASLQVETSTGKRQKVKAANVLLRFAAPAPSALLEAAARLSGELDPNFLWEVSGEDEFGFAELAAEYHGKAPKPEETAAFALRLHASPMHFYKRGKGRYRRAPIESLKAALAGAERKKREAAQIAAWGEDLAARRLPEAFRPVLAKLLYGPDKQSIEFKALDAACAAMRTNALRLLDECGAIPSSHDYHFNRFLFHAFPRGVDFPPFGEIPPLPDLPECPVPAFTIDDRTTTEFDDAFSVQAIGGGRFQVGIHISAPALGIARGSALDAIARSRLSTVYLPGNKITMLPEPVVDRFSLAAGQERPVLSLYLEVTADGHIERQFTALDRVRIASNLRLAEIDGSFGDSAQRSGQPHEEELRLLWQVAQRLEAARGKSDVERIDYSFYVDWARAPDGHVSIVPRLRGSPLDKLVAELAIHVNSSWGKLLADAGWPGLFRTQQQGKVKMSTRPEPHQGLGVAHYLWASSPLRRFSDLANQRQLLALLSGQKPAYAEGDAELFAALVDFETTYASFAEFQNQMEHYWCLRWLLQEGVSEVRATVIRDNLVRFDRLPLIVRVGDLPSLAPDTDVNVAIGAIDLLAATMEVRFVRVAGA